MKLTGPGWRRVVRATRPIAPSRTVTHWLRVIVAGLLIGAVVPAAVADEGGVSLWLTGQFGSLAAVPPDPGWSLPIIYYHGSVDAGGGKNFKIGGQITAGVDGRADLLFLAPTYTLETPVLAGRASLSVAGAFGNMDVSADATLTGPRGNVLRASPSDSLFSGSDLYPMASLRWNDGNHNYMTYVIPMLASRPGS